MDSVAASLLLALELALAELVEPALSNACEEADVDDVEDADDVEEADDVEDADDVESSAESKSARNVFRSFDNSLRSALRLDDDDADADEAELVEEAVDDDDDSSAERRLARSVSSVDRMLLALDDEVEEVEDVEELEELGGGPGGGPPAPPGPPGPWLSLPDEPLPLSCERNASTVADSPTELEASIVDAVLLAELDVLAVALDCVDALFWLARVASNILRSRLSWLLPDTVRLMTDSPDYLLFYGKSSLKLG